MPDQVGRMRRRVSVQAPAPTSDSFGSEVLGSAAATGPLTDPTWPEQFRCWAEFKSLTGVELFAASQVQVLTRYKVRIRYRDGVIAKWRLVEILTARILNIEAVLGWEYRRWIDLLCTE